MKHSFFLLETYRREVHTGRGVNSLASASVGYRGASDSKFASIDLVEPPGRGQLLCSIDPEQIICDIFVHLI